ncbi:hypothetical protein KFK09_010630 [Dendrobium nobile]|uniref:Uncharacterized protein n=1 Tax=Dendrobium nobile TaxID=94219 RepID=A0A8T3BCM5_DENNO|nr:hypothetical protein KFK09_010630 [Dendrobium nobile]
MRGVLLLYSNEVRIVQFRSCLFGSDDGQVFDEIPAHEPKLTFFFVSFIPFLLQCLLSVLPQTMHFRNVDDQLAVQTGEFRRFVVNWYDSDHSDWKRRADLLTIS